MFGRGKETELERALTAKVLELSRLNTDLKNQVAHLVNNSRRWAAKFKNPLYAVPDKVIRDMEEETAKYRQKTRAEISQLRARIALLNEKVIDLTEEQYKDKFGRPTGADISFELATDHINAVPTDRDRKAVDIQLSEGWQQRFAKHAQVSKE